MRRRASRPAQAGCSRQGRFGGGRRQRGGPRPIRSGPASGVLEARGGSGKAAEAKRRVREALAKLLETGTSWAREANSGVEGQRAPENDRLEGGLLRALPPRGSVAASGLFGPPSGSPPPGGAPTLGRAGSSAPACGDLTWAGALRKVAGWRRRERQDGVARGRRCELGRRAEKPRQSPTVSSPPRFLSEHPQLTRSSRVRTHLLGLDVWSCSSVSSVRERLSCFPCLAGLMTGPDLAYPPFEPSAQINVHTLPVVIREAAPSDAWIYLHKHMHIMYTRIVTYSCNIPHYVYTYTLIPIILVIYVDTHMHTYMHTHIHTYTCTHLHVCKCAHMHIYTHARIHIYTYTHIHIYAYAHIHMYTCTHVTIDTHTRILYTCYPCTACHNLT